jgi:cytochrome c peroxidase
VNIGLYNLSGQNTYPSADQGLRRFTKRSEDDGKFKIPSLRNVMLTAPYMHDGSVADLQQVIDLYARGGRNTTVGDYPGDGAKHKNKHPLIRGFELSAEEKDDLIRFLSALTDTSYLSNPQFRDPFRK